MWSRRRHPPRLAVKIRMARLDDHEVVVADPVQKRPHLARVQLAHPLEGREPVGRDRQDDVASIEGIVGATDEAGLDEPLDDLAGRRGTDAEPSWRAPTTRAGRSSR